MNTPIPHRCAGLPENASAHIVTLPQGDRVLVAIEFGDYAGQTRGGAFPFCPGCGAHASFLAAGWI